MYRKKTKKYFSNKEYRLLAFKKYVELWANDSIKEINTTNPTLWTQLNNSTHSVTGSLGLKEMKQILREMHLYYERSTQKTYALQLMDSGKIKPTEYLKLLTMIDSEDDDNLYLAEQIIIHKSNG